MKTLKFIITLSFIPAALFSVAQSTSGNLVYPYYSPDIRKVLVGGVKIGFNYSTLYNTTGENFTKSPLFGPVFGGFLSVPFNTYLGFQPELLYSAKGFLGNGTSSDGQYSFIDRMNYIDIPLLFQFKPSPYIYLLGGPEYSYLISRDYTFLNGVTSVSAQQEFQKDKISHNVLGLIAGIEINYARLALGGRLGWDLMNNNSNSTSPAPSYRNFWGQATLGYRI